MNYQKEFLEIRLISIIAMSLSFLIYLITWF